MKTNRYFALSVLAAVISGCGGSDSGSNDIEPTYTTVSGTAISSVALSSSLVCLDFDATSSCNSGYETETDSDGNFSINVEDSVDLSQAVITVIEEQKVRAFSSLSSTQSVEDTINYQSYIALASDSKNITVSPLTSQVTDKVILNGSQQVEDFNVTLKRATVEVKELNEMTDIDDDVLFGNYLDTSNTTTEISSQVQKKASQVSQWRQRANEIKKELKDNPDYSDWNIIKPVVWNVYQYSYHTGEYINRYEEYVYLARHDSGNLIERYEGTQWLVDTEGNPIPDAILQHYEEDKSWEDDEITVHTYWEFDYNQDKSFDFKGEKFARGNYTKSANDNHELEMLELYNEGNPADEDGWWQDRHYDENCDLESEFKKLSLDETLDTCVDMYEIREYNNYTDAGGKSVKLDYMTEYKKPGDDITQPITFDYVAYYEEREIYWMPNGGQGTDIRKDWDAKSKAAFDLDQKPFNVIQRSYLESNGERSLVNEVPVWAGQASSTDSTASTIRLLSQVNPMSWGSMGNAFVYEDLSDTASKQEFTSVTTPLNISTEYDENRQDYVTLNLPYIDANGDRAEVIKHSLTLDKETGSVTAETTFEPISDSDAHNLTPEMGPVQAVTVNTAIEQLDAVNGIVPGNQTITVNDEQSTSPAFTDGYFKSSWNVTSSDLPDTLMSLLFAGGNDFTFQSSRNINDDNLNGSMCWDKDVDRVDMDLMYLNAGDLVLTVYCDGNWVNNEDSGTGSSHPSQYLLKMTKQLEDTGTFTATLNSWNYGENIFFDDPTIYTLEFTKSSDN
ncbi:hypothetical protein [Vibrio sp. B1FLJ16]|uniref:hypothetical protein n=1 Tax=Vibrio sp. B1FLJ16 TaxID=2751178 RepID=UPI0015F59839|nr:hypothetical protein [Vibrio sp. B1FLJ16]CAD7807488.1 hypothetical protein ACOMICROBIO_EPCKBFOG_01678 [Vibrio sp. B1FLJ16]CAE6905746.1 hypothetical protein ACOMICROBIO_EPCKBFOG_01678 [Vibrio sp. B1FLJ16]